MVWKFSKQSISNYLHAMHTDKTQPITAQQRLNPTTWLAQASNQLERSTPLLPTYIFFSISTTSLITNLIPIMISSFYSGGDSIRYRCTKEDQNLLEPRNTRFCRIVKRETIVGVKRVLLCYAFFRGRNGTMLSVIALRWCFSMFLYLRESGNMD